MHVVQSPCLKTLSLSWIKNMPLLVFISLSPDITVVKLDGVKVKIQQDSDSTPRLVAPSQTKRRLPQIKNLHYYDHDTGGILAFRSFIFDFEQLQFLQISWGNVPQCALGRKLIKAANKLEGLACAVDSPVKSAAGLAKAILDNSSDVSLTALTIGLSHKTTSPTIPDPDEYDPFLGLIEELVLLAGKNTVKDLMVHFDTTKDTHDELTGCLSRFDEVITREAFPRLERFDLEFWVHYSWPYYAPYGSGLEECWAECNGFQCRGVSTIPGLRFDCPLVIIDG
ncbi:unnamed protein product [Cyclocybe aegerita]|uniref:Uncharacterized protein n=1 Tax=Cyclocybe aegerita TaxID=1973307 RepID=A0A8S0WMN9_CYCAE|nr:unnamed protein product [Cyclocybe aegerita]